jgi:MarR family transcriptional regulator, lower aerobic nicotinate degradation pathway regulator
MAPTQDLDRSYPVEGLGLTDALVQLSFLVQSVLGRIAAANDLSITQVRVLGVLRDREPGMQQLAHLLHLDKSSVTGLIDRAERRGLVKRLPSSGDGRAVRVSPTPLGRQVMAEVERLVDLELSHLARPLTDREQKQLSRLASRLALIDSRGIDD